MINNSSGIKKSRSSSSPFTLNNNFMVGNMMSTTEMSDPEL